MSAAPLGDPAQWLERAARSDPGRVFLATPEGRTLDYASAHTRCARLAATLGLRGIVAGDRVAARTEKSPEAILLYLACLRIGAVFVPINAASTASELDYLLRDAEPRLLVDGEEALGELARTSAPDGAAPAALDAHAPAAIVYTSGTTGRPKGAILTRANLASNATALAAAWRFTGTDVLLHVLPLAHVHGLFAALNTVLASASGVLLLPKFEAAAVLQHLGAVTVFMGVPTHYTRLVKEPALDRHRTRHMRLFVSGSAPLLAQTHEEFRARTGHAILERYGMTETLMNTSNPYEGPRLPGSVGPPLPGISVRVVDRERGANEAEPETIGQLEISGPNVFAGYWRDPAKSAESFTADGYFRTGDLGHIDHNGYVHIVGRAKDLIITGGYNVYPKEVELQLDALAGVAESAVFGVPHPDFGEGVTAAVVLEPGAELSESAIIAHARTYLARYKVPKRILLLSELPRNALGKVQKNVLRAAHERLYVSF